MLVWFLWNFYYSPRRPSPIRISWDCSPTVWAICAMRGSMYPGSAWSRPYASCWKYQLLFCVLQFRWATLKTLFLFYWDKWQLCDVFTTSAPSWCCWMPGAVSRARRWNLWLSAGEINLNLHFKMTSKMRLTSFQHKSHLWLCRMEITGDKKNGSRLLMIIW